MRNRLLFCLVPFAMLGVSPALADEHLVRSVDVFPTLEARCANAALPTECRMAGQAAWHARLLLRRCESGTDSPRFTADERDPSGTPSRAAVLAACQDASDLCTQSWLIFADRQRRSGAPGVDDAQLKNHVETYAQCQISIRTMQE